ncbi:MAG: NADH-quinone oxidoreductase subunit NuoG [Wenzhouxiangellaceae bacterium]
MSAQPQQDLVTIEIDGTSIEVPKGSMIIEAADKLGIDIPRFCYHRKLSIAANCRMCLVDVEKAPKPLPACATPVMDGMKVFTESRRAVDAQHGVMEFLLINHPLDCPICDQGGECELQDLAMGYGRSVSRFSERKRVVKDENLGPLISTDMTRCIHCTRCVRFLEEVAGTRELGGIGRGEKTQIKTFIGRSVDSELSGNIIDLCPVGALTNKPFRFSARPWELVARASVAAHDCVGSHLWYHVRRNTIMRAVPRDEESINETWLADRDRYSHYGLYSDDRLQQPMIKRDGEWQECDWATALEATAEALKAHGGNQLGVLAAPQHSSEALYLLAKLARALGSNNIDHRLRALDFSDDAAQPRHPELGLPIAAIESAQSILLIGSNIRHDQPMLGNRVRNAWRLHGAKVMTINPVDYEFRFEQSAKAIVPPQQMLNALGAVAKAAGAELSGALAQWLNGIEVDDNARAMADQLKSTERGWIYLGDFAAHHPQAAALRAVARALAAATGASVGGAVIGNGVGAWLAGAVPHRDVNGATVDAGLNALEQLRQPRQAYLLMGCESDWDVADGAAARAAFAQAKSVIAITAFVSDSLRRDADILLPAAALAESGGTVHNIEGRALRFAAAANAPGQARPAWKILRMLGEMLVLDGFDQRNFEELQAEFDSALLDDPNLQPAAGDPAVSSADDTQTLWRIGDVPMFAGDGLVRRSQPLQQTVHAENAACALNPADAQSLGLSDGQTVRVSQGDASVELPLQIFAEVPQGGAWVRAAVAETIDLGAAIGPISVTGV